MHSDLEWRATLTAKLVDNPYDCRLYLERALCHQHLGYSDLAAGDAYKALLLSDEVADGSGEYHDQASECLETSWAPSQISSANGCRVDDLVADLERNLKPEEIAGRAAKHAYVVLGRSLIACACLQPALELVNRGLRRFPTDSALLDLCKGIAGLAPKGEDSNAPSRGLTSAEDLPKRGHARRELYPWNDHEPDRYAQENLDFLNAELASVAPKCEVKAVDLPMLGTSSSETVRQLGLFAKEGIEPDEVLLQETSLLAANNRFQDPLCDACSAELGGQDAAYACPECDDAVFCSQRCLDSALELYHPAVCGSDTGAVVRDAKPADMADSLYLLLLARAFAMAETQDVHPLDLKEVRFLWGDFETPPSSPEATTSTAGSLPFSFDFNVLYPIHILEKMDIDIYATLARYDTWVVNTLYAKIRGVASGSVNPTTGKPEVCAVHPLWCLANHSCAPNVRWEWGATIRFWARNGKNLVRWNPAGHQSAGIERGQEILSHYCDVDLDVNGRRDWARGALGGTCLCERCVWEAGQASN